MIHTRFMTTAWSRLAPAIERLTLSEGDWIEIKRELTVAGHKRLRRRIGAAIAKAKPTRTVIHLARGRCREVRFPGRPAPIPFAT